MKHSSDEISSNTPAGKAHQPETPFLQPQTSQPRLHDRGAIRSQFDVPIQVQVGERASFGHTLNICAGGFAVISSQALEAGLPLLMTFSFAETARLDVSGQTVYCDPHQEGYQIGIRFAPIRDWEQMVLLSMVKELRDTRISREHSFVTILLGENPVRLKALQHGGSSKTSGTPLQRSDLPPRYKEFDFAPQSVHARREWLTRKTGVPLDHIALLSEPTQNLQGNIENLIGATHVPLGIAGPIRVNGEDANGLYYVPMATTEGAITYTYSRGMHLVSMAGGVNTRMVRDEIHISPIFVFQNLETAQKFTAWLGDHFERIKSEAEKTTRHGRLLRLEPHIFDRSVAVKFCYATGDAMGLNMINIATEEACHWIVPQVRPEEFFLRSNFSSVKKISAHNYAVAGFGKTLMADVTIPRALLKRLFKVSPETMARYCHLSFVSSAHAGMVGMNGHSANGLAAIFIACGQDVGNVVDSQASVSSCEVTKQGDLYVSVKIPNLVVGTVGGGMTLGSQRECLEILGCYGTGKVRKFSEIVAATVLAGEIAVAAAICTETFVSAHKKYGRKPK
jgi:hydroxymethylglutaryl-CoA reductase (NADPH)